MFARLSRYEVEPDRIDDAIQGFREASDALAELDGALGGYLLVDPETGNSITITLWESRAALDGSDTKAARLRRNAMEASGGSVQAVQTYEVPVEFRSTPG
jgi:heme-degrading monooxygenase HmoA